MTELDALMSEGLGVLDEIAGETFHYREVDRPGNVGEIVTTREPRGGGFKYVRSLTILYRLANGPIAPETGETIFARGIKLKVASAIADKTSVTVQCIDYAE